MKTVQFRQNFPGLERRIQGKPLIYFDNAATSLRPKCLMDFLQDAGLYHNANIHRAVHTLAAEATDAYEAARDAVVRFTGASSRREIIFTSGATASINLVAYAFGLAFVHAGDEIVVGVAEHHSNFVPWQQLSLRAGATVKYLHPSERGIYEAAQLEQLLSPRTRLVCIGHASNVLGLVNPVRDLVDTAHAQNVPVLVDGAQGAVHCKVDVQALDCDFYAFSGHKLLGPTGVGVLYGKEKWLEQMPPFMFGGEMVGSVGLDKTTFAPLPVKFEAGTQNFINVAGMVPSLALMEEMQGDVELNTEFTATCKWLADSLQSIDGLKLFGDVAGQGVTKLPIFSFTINGVHHEDLAILLDKMGIAVRSGQMCAEPLMTECGETGMLRASLMPYNTQEEAELFIACLRKAIRMLR